jgi:hypothetical protein
MSFCSWGSENGGVHCDGDRSVDSGAAFFACHCNVGRFYSINTAFARCLSTQNRSDKYTFTLNRLDGIMSMVPRSVASICEAG